MKPSVLAKDPYLLQDSVSVPISPIVAIIGGYLLPDVTGVGTRARLVVSVGAGTEGFRGMPSVIPEPQTVEGVGTSIM